MFQIVNEKEYLKYSAAIENRKLLLDYIWPNLWERKVDMLYWISYFHQNEYIICRKWVETDLSSVSCFLECVMSKQKYVIAVIHDEWYSLSETYVYVKDKNNLSSRFAELQEYWEWINEHTFLPNRKFWDLLFFYWMIEENCYFYKWRWNFISYLAYLVLRLVWKIKYKKKK